MHTSTHAHEQIFSTFSMLPFSRSCRVQKIHPRPFEYAPIGLRDEAQLQTIVEVLDSSRPAVADSAGGGNGQVEQQAQVHVCTPRGTCCGPILGSRVGVVEVAVSTWPSSSCTLCMYSG